MNPSSSTYGRVEPVLERGRLRVLGMAFFLMLGLLIFQLGKKQIFEYDHFKALAYQQQVAEYTNTAERGFIYASDKSGANFGSIDGKKIGNLYPLAINITRYDISAVPNNVVGPEKTVEKLASVINDINKEELVTKLSTDKLYLPPIKKSVEKEVADAVKNLGLKGIMVVPRSVRYYPEGNMAAQLIGFVNHEGEGAAGLEMYYNNELKGIPGLTHGLKDTFGRIIAGMDSSMAQDGVNLVLTLDSTVQFIVERELKDAIEKYGAQGGSVIVVEPKSGRILAMASEPGYNPNEFNKLPQEEQWKFVNPVVTNAWEPGSIMKPVIMAAALNEGKIEPDTIPEDLPGGFSNQVTIDGYEIHNAEDRAYGYQTMTQVLERSDNIGMVWVADKLGNDTMARYLSEFGFGSKTGIDIGAEGVGKLLDSKRWRNVHRATISFGQGISVTPIQMVMAYSVLANHGKLVQPHLLDRVISSSGEEKKVEAKEVREVISAETADEVKEMLVNVVEKGHGKKARVEGFRVAGKTGTAQVAKESGGYEESAHIGSFIGYAPADDPKFVMLVKLDRPTNVEFAESSAAPTFGAIAKWLLNNYYVD